MAKQKTETWACPVHKCNVKGFGIYFLRHVTRCRKQEEDRQKNKVQLSNLPRPKQVQVTFCCNNEEYTSAIRQDIAQQQKYREIDHFMLDPIHNWSELSAEYVIAASRIHYHV